MSAEQNIETVRQMYDWSSGVPMAGRVDGWIRWTAIVCVALLFSRFSHELHELVP